MEKFLEVVRLLTSSTRPNPPTPSVSMMLKSARLRLKKNAFSASYLQESRRRRGKHLRAAEERERDAALFRSLSPPFTTHTRILILVLIQRGKEKHTGPETLTTAPQEALKAQKPVLQWLLRRLLMARNQLLRKFLMSRNRPLNGSSGSS